MGLRCGRWRAWSASGTGDCAGACAAPGSGRRSWRSRSSTGSCSSLLPPYAAGPPGVFPGVLLAGFVNLLAVAVVAPLAGVAAPPPPPGPAAGRSPPTTRARGCWRDHRAARGAAGCCTARRSRRRTRARRPWRGRCTTTCSRSAPEYRGRARHDRRHPHRPRLLPRLRPGRGRAALALPVREHRPEAARGHARHRASRLN